MKWKEILHNEDIQRLDESLDEPEVGRGWVLTW
jgi:hypothetical protein